MFMYFCFVFCSPRSSACPFSLSRGWDKCANLKRKGLISRIKKDIFEISNMMDADSETVTFVSQLKFRCFDKDMWKNYILIVFRILTFLSGPNSLQFFSSKNRLISSWFKFCNLYTLELHYFHPTWLHCFCCTKTLSRIYLHYNNIHYIIIMAF